MDGRSINIAKSINVHVALLKEAVSFNWYKANMLEQGGQVLLKSVSLVCLRVFLTLCGLQGTDLLIL